MNSKNTIEHVCLGTCGQTYTTTIHVLHISVSTMVSILTPILAPFVPVHLPVDWIPLYYSQCAARATQPLFVWKFPAVKSSPNYAHRLCVLSICWKPPLVVAFDALLSAVLGIPRCVRSTNALNCTWCVKSRANLCLRLSHVSSGRWFQHTIIEWIRKSRPVQYLWSSFWHGQKSMTTCPTAINNI